MKKQLKATAVYMMHCNGKKEGIWGMKIVKNMMVIMAVLMVGAVVAKNLEVQQQPVTTTQQPVIGARTQQIRPGVVQRQVTPALSTQASKSINPEEWKQIIAELTLPGRIPSKSQINEIRQFNLTNDQKVTLNMIEQNIDLNKQLKMQQVQMVRERQRKGLKSTGVVKPKGFFAGLWETGPESDEIEAYKMMIKNTLDNTEKYPTLKAKEEALDLGIEFFETEYSDARIMKQAQNALKKELAAEALSANEKMEQNKINNQIAELRDEFGFDLSELLSIDDLNINDLKTYIQNIKMNIKDFVVKNITNENAIAIFRAIFSELQRINNIIEIKTTRSRGGFIGSTQKKSPVMKETTWRKALQDWWYGSKGVTSIIQQPATGQQ